MAQPVEESQYKGFYLAGFAKVENEDTEHPHSSEYIAAHLFSSLANAKEGIESKFSNPQTQQFLTDWQEHPNRKGHFIRQFRSFNNLSMMGVFWVRLFPAPINDALNRMIMDWSFDRDPQG